MIKLKDILLEQLSKEVAEMVGGEFVYKYWYTGDAKYPAGWYHVTTEEIYDAVGNPDSFNDYWKYFWQYKKDWGLIQMASNADLDASDVHNKTKAPVSWKTVAWTVPEIDTDTGEVNRWYKDITGKVPDESKQTAVRYPKLPDDGFIITKLAIKKRQRGEYLDLTVKDKKGLTPTVSRLKRELTTGTNIWAHHGEDHYRIKDKRVYEGRILKYGGTPGAYIAFVNKAPWFFEFFEEGVASIFIHHTTGNRGDYLEGYINTDVAAFFMKKKDIYYIQKAKESDLIMTKQFSADKSERDEWYNQNKPDESLPVYGSDLKKSW